MEPQTSLLKQFLIVAFLVIATLGLGIGGCASYNAVRVWNASQAGKAQLAEATSNRQIKTLEARAKMESAKFEAAAEIERARGAAQANKILQNSLGGPSGYLEYLKIQAMADKNTQLIYVPTEGQLPITEAGRK